MTGTELRDWIENRKKAGLDDIDDLVDVGKYIHANIRSRISHLAPNLEKEARATRKTLAPEIISMGMEAHVPERV